MKLNLWKRISQWVFTDSNKNVKTELKRLKTPLIFFLLGGMGVALVGNGGAILSTQSPESTPKTTPTITKELPKPSPTIEPTITSKPVVKGTSTEIKPTIVQPTSKSTNTPIPTAYQPIEVDNSNTDSNNYQQVSEEIAQVESNPQPPTATPGIEPCVCIESWGAGGFVGNCDGVDSNCQIKYSCLLPDRKRLGVWNEDQTKCLEEHIRYVGEQSNSSQTQTNAGLSQSECDEKKKALQAERDSKIAEVNRANEEFIDSIGEDYASRGLYNSGERRTEQGRAEVARNASIERIENEYQQKLSGLKSEGCNI